MLHKDSKHDLLQIYNLFKRAPETLGEIIHRFGSFFEIEGSQIISDPTLDKDPIQFTNKLLELKKRADDLVNHQFLSNLNFQRRRDVTFQILLNKFEKAPVFLASYLDYEFKKGNLE
jgi:Cullin, a subunit of E3 ubiquitin ligase